MANDFSIPDFDGDEVVVAARDVGGVYHPRKALSIWGGSSFSDLTFGQAAMAASLPVVLASDHSDVRVTLDSEAVAVTLAAGPTAVAKAEDAASANADVGVPAMAVRKATPANTSGTDGDYEMLQMSAGRLWVDASGVTLTVDTELPSAAALSDALANPTTSMIAACLTGWDGSQWVRVRVPNVFKDLIAVSITSIATVWTPASGKKFRLMGGCVSVSAAASVLFEDNTASNTVYRTPKLLADTPFNFDVPGGKLSATADNVLKATASAAAAITGTIWGTEE